MKEYILCAAINFDGTIICGHRHSDCYAILKSLLSKYTTPDKLPEREDQGFLTSLNRYVSRTEAWKIAKANNQIKYGLGATSEIESAELISENLY